MLNRFRYVFNKNLGVGIGIVFSFAINAKKGESSLEAEEVAEFVTKEKVKQQDVGVAKFKA